MPGPKPLSVILSEKQRALLERLKRRQTSPQRLVRRVDTILAAADGETNESIAHQLGLNRTTVWTWRQRWRAGAEALDAAEAAGDADKVLLARIEALLDDAPRSGSPGDFSAEQLARCARGVAACCVEAAEAKGVFQV